MSRPARGGDAADCGEVARRLRGRVQMVLTHAELTTDPRPLALLLDEVAEALGPDSSLALLVEYGVEELRSRNRSVAASARVWDDLHVRADAALDRRDTTLMSIKALHARYARLSGDEVDRDAAVDGYEVEWRRRLAMLGPREHRTSTAHANLATALRERGTPDDLRRSCLIARQEIAVRLAAWGQENSFTWIPQIILAQCLLKVAERACPPQEGATEPGEAGTAPAADSPTSAGGPAEAGVDDRADGIPAPREGPRGYPLVTEDDLARPAADLVAEGRSLAEAVVAARQDRFGPASVATLRAQLVRAHALLLAGEPAAAIAEIRYVLATNRRVGANLDPGWPELMLARALLAAGLADGGASLDDAVRQARVAVEARLGRYPAGTERVTEAERFEREARRLASQAAGSPAETPPTPPSARSSAENIPPDRTGYGVDHRSGSQGSG